MAKYSRIWHFYQDLRTRQPFAHPMGCMAKAVEESSDWRPLFERRCRAVSRIGP